MGWEVGWEVGVGLGWEVGCVGWGVGVGESRTVQQLAEWVRRKNWLVRPCQ